MLFVHMIVDVIIMFGILQFDHSSVLFLYVKTFNFIPGMFNMIGNNKAQDDTDIQSRP